ncbi:TetR/AcrR family transcriptional regulator [Pelagibius sp. Alg239-R121]|uniref:TetR/AcrR family transcriptional regulator n=1 Tax=Pelagibius sp. Alg239-R121 TaxID=2993448 RepID=UPI0024A61832|nr:TetR/AcrR family transcriptional regulator [Pelagibius sp. Alg239-R121]
MSHSDHFSPAEKAKRLGRQDWLEIGLRQLATAGPGALRIDRLCGAANKTRGSFYHHFEDRAVFVTAMLDHWSQHHTEAVIREVERHDDPRAKRAALNQLAAALDQGVETAIRRMAATDQAARNAVERVDGRRIGYLAEINAQEFDLPDSDAALLAEVEYATFVGYQNLFPAAGQERYERVGRLLDVMVRAGAAAGRDNEG